MHKKFLSPRGYYGKYAGMWMKPPPAAPGLLCLVCICATGCATIEPEPPPPPYMTQAVLKSFTETFDASWKGVSIYLQDESVLPESLDTVGAQPVEVVTREELIDRYRYEAVSPAIAVVSATEDQHGLIHVTIRYSPIHIEGLDAPERAETYQYIYRRLPDGDLRKLYKVESHD
jgi:hypothetical protein